MNYRVIYQHSFDRVMNRNIEGKTFFQYFYSVFLESNPSIKKAFGNSDVDKLASVVKGSFKLLTQFSENHTDSEALRYVSYIHGPKQKNISPNSFKYWEESLIKTVKAFDPEYSESVELSWRIAVSPGLKYLEFFYNKDEARIFRVALIDDESDLTEIISDYIASPDIVVTCFNAPEKALEAIKKIPFNLVISDISMGKMNGIELLRWVKMFNNSLPFWIMTGSSDYNQEKLLKEGTQHVIYKPLDLDDLFNKIEIIRKEQKRL